MVFYFKKGGDLMRSVLVIAAVVCVSLVASESFAQCFTGSCNSGASRNIVLQQVANPAFTISASPVFAQPQFVLQQAAPQFEFRQLQAAPQVIQLQQQHSGRSNINVNVNRGFSFGSRVSVRRGLFGRTIIRQF